MSMRWKVQLIFQHTIKTLHVHNTNIRRHSLQESSAHYCPHSFGIMTIFSSIQFLGKAIEEHCFCFEKDVHSPGRLKICSSEQHINYLHWSKQKKNQTNMTTYSPSFAQIARATLSIISEPSKNTESQIFRTVWLGRQVAKRVRNHCMVKTFVRGGS